MEIERKFKVSDKEIVNEIINKYHRKEIVQDYLYIDEYTVVRKRKVKTNKSIKYIYTVKTMKQEYSVNEFEKEITKEQYDSMKKNNNYITLEKDRYVIPYINNLNIELDIFHGVYEGVVFAEIEFEDEQQVNNVLLPKWFGMDISNIVTNSQMACNKEFKNYILNQI